MSGKIYRADQKHPEEYQEDMNPDAVKGVNFGLAGPHPEKDQPRTARDVKAVHQLLAEFPDDELERIPILPSGTRLEAKATYISLKDPQRREFSAKGDEDVAEADWVVPKAEVDYELWNKLTAGQSNTSLPPR
jgi:hypothetical protein